jgi:hypothetical protein
MDCSPDFTEMFIFNILQVEQSLYSFFTLESISFDRQSSTVSMIVGLDCIQYPSLYCLWLGVPYSNAWSKEGSRYISYKVRRLGLRQE